MSLNIFKDALAERQAAKTTISTPASYHAIMNRMRDVVKLTNGGPGSGRRAGGYKSPDINEIPPSDQKYHRIAGNAEALEANAYRSNKTDDYHMAAIEHGKAATLARKGGAPKLEKYHLASMRANETKSQAVSNSLTNPDGSFKLVNGSQESTLVYHFMGEGHSEESAKRMANSLLNGGPGSGVRGHIGSFQPSEIDRQKSNAAEFIRQHNEYRRSGKRGSMLGSFQPSELDRQREDANQTLSNSTILLNAETDNVCLPGTANGLATASSKAAAASEAAEADGTAGSHFAAKNAHEAAGNLAARLGDTETASKHASKASEHAGKGVAAYPKGQTDKKNAGSAPAK